MSQLWWWVARSSGMVAAVLVALTLVWGLLVTTKLIPRRGLPAWLTDMHRMLGGLSVAFIGIHLLALVLDSYVHFSWAELFVPFRSAYRSGPVAWGVVAFWLLVVVEGSSLLKRWMPRPLWRRLHLLSYPVAVAVAVHATTAGTDSENPVLRLVTLALAVMLGVLVVDRLLTRPRALRSIDRGVVAADLGLGSPRRADHVRGDDRVGVARPGIGTVERRSVTSHDGRDDGRRDVEAIGVRTDDGRDDRTGRGLRAR